MRDFRVVIKYASGGSVSLNVEAVDSQQAEYIAKMMVKSDAILGAFGGEEIDSVEVYTHEQS